MGERKMKETERGKFERMKKEERELKQRKKER